MWREDWDSDMETMLRQTLPNRTASRNVLTAPAVSDTPRTLLPRFSTLVYKDNKGRDTFVRLRRMGDTWQVMVAFTELGFKCQDN